MALVMQNHVPWIPLQAHSDYSLVKGLAKPQALIQHAARFKIPAMALTDCVSCAGWPRFAKAAYSAGIKPIVGISLRMELEEGIEGQATLLVKDNTGYRRLMEWISSLWQSAPSGADAERLKLHWKDWEASLPHTLLLLHGGEGGAATALCALGRPPSWLKPPQVRSHLYLTLERWSPAPFPWESLIRARAADWGLVTVATQPILFLRPEDSISHTLRVAIQRNLWGQHESLQTPELASAHFPEPHEIAERYRGLEVELKRTWEIAKRCNLFPEPFAFRLPRVETPPGMSDNELLKRKAESGLQARWERHSVEAEQQPLYFERLKRELEMIAKMGFSSYFLVVFEFIHWAKSAQIPVGPGRGSGVGSLVAYALGITDLDPLKYHLLFERFLNPARISMPDFDIDFCPQERDRVIDHVIERYGEDRVAQIAAFGNLRARASVRDVGRALNYPYGLIDKWARAIPVDPTITLREAIATSPMLKQAYEGDEEIRKLLGHALALEGVQRHMGKHAGGVVIAPEPLTHFTPLVKDSEGARVMTQFDKGDIEALGLVKFDFLGLTTLTILKETLKSLHAYQRDQGEAELDLLSVPLDDAKSFDLLQSGKTEAVFQLDTRGAKALVTKLKPDKFEEIIALVALNRPGPLQSGMVDNFIHRKQGQEPVAYPDASYQHESLKPILEETYGIILYQEQVIQIAQVLAGYSLFEADLFRRAMGKKDEAVMSAQRKRFVEGAEARGVESELALKIFELVDKFAGYGFNKSHSAAYALVSYQTLYLKAHAPDFFMAAVLTSEIGHFEKLPSLLEATWSIGARIAPADINRSFGYFCVLKRGEILYGLEAIRGVGKRMVDAIVEARQKGGPFQNLADFCSRLPTSAVPKSMIEKLITAGAFDGIESSRATAWAQLPHLLKSVEKHQASLNSGQQSLFDEPDLQAQALPELKPSIAFWNDIDQAFKSYRALGHFLPPHPLWIVQEELALLGAPLESTPPWQERLASSAAWRAPSVSTTAAVLERIRVMRNKQNESFSVLTLTGHQGCFEAFWPGELSREVAEGLQAGEVAVGRGNWKTRMADEMPRIHLKQLTTLRALRRQRAKSIHLRFHGHCAESQGNREMQVVLAWLKGLQSIRGAHYELYGEVDCAEGAAGRPVWSLKPPEDSKFLSFDFHSFPLLEASPFFECLQSLRVRYPQGEVAYWNSPRAGSSR